MSAFQKEKRQKRINTKKRLTRSSLAVLRTCEKKKTVLENMYICVRVRSQSRSMQFQSANCSTTFLIIAELLEQFSLREFLQNAFSAPLHVLFARKYVTPHRSPDQQPHSTALLAKGTDQALQLSHLNPQHT